jgi:glycerol uptake facilitator-like aquaporin
MSGVAEPARVADRARIAARPLVAETLGTGLLVATVVGSGIMAERLSGGNVAIALLANTIATGAILYVLITVFGALSSHFNPAVTLVALVRREVSRAQGIAMIIGQIVGGVAGTWLAHAMFAEPILQLSAKLRDGPAQVLSEFVATFGLVLTILATVKYRPAQIAPAVALYITAAYWFTASTSFANPAVTIARALSNTFAGIAPSSAPEFIVAECVGALAAAGLAGWMFERR